MLKLDKIPALTISDLTVEADHKKIVQNFNLVLNSGEVHALMGPNGSGKSTLAFALIGHPHYQITAGKIKLLAQDIQQLPTDQRALAGLFLSWQQPPALPGVKVTTFLHTALNQHRQAQGKNPLDLVAFIKQLRAIMLELGLNPKFANRSLNDGFSGGEKKYFEILQALLLQPKVFIIDEIDSGLDVDAIKIVAAGINKLIVKGTAVMIITHYHRILNYVKPDYVHIIYQGQLVKTGNLELVKTIEQSSYQTVLNHAPF